MRCNDSPVLIKLISFTSRLRLGLSIKAGKYPPLTALAYSASNLRAEINGSEFSKLTGVYVVFVFFIVCLP